MIMRPAEPGSYSPIVSSDQALEAFRRGDDGEAERLAAAELKRALGESDTAARIDALCMLARIALRRNDLDTVLARAREARAAATAAGDRTMERMPLHLEAVANRMGGQLAEARTLYLQSISLNDELGEARMAALEHRNLAYVELRAGDSGRARALIAESQRRLADVDAPVLKPYLTFDEATVAALEGDAVGAARKLATADEQFLAAGVIPDPDDAVEMARLRASLRASR